MSNRKGPERSGFTRRRFLQGVGAGALAAGTLAPPALAAKLAPQDKKGAPLLGPDPVPVTLEINGKKVTLPLEPRVTLLDALRNHLDLTGAKKVCDRATCGACTVLLDGKAVYACTVLAIEAQGRTIETIEGLAATNDGLAKMSHCFVENDAQQCGFCTPGFVMACESFRRAHDHATRDEVVHGLGGNLCRCGTYHGITHAVLEALEGGK